MNGPNPHFQFKSYLFTINECFFMEYHPNKKNSTFEILNENLKQIWSFCVMNLVNPEITYWSVIKALPPGFQKLMEILH